jgi:predicted MFS family arabinose efflux permease
LGEPQVTPPNTAATAARRARLLTIVPLLGIAQIISWGSLYYSLAVLSLPIRHELGLSELATFGAFSAGLLLSGVVAPYAGRRVDDHGGRGVMTAGSAIAALAMCTIALAHGPVLFTLGWMLAGIAMAGCLYEPAFASLHQIAPDHYRRAVTGMTLFGGFASTVFWPLSNELASAWGWRAAFLCFAVLHIFVCVPIHLRVLPGRAPGPAEHVRAETATTPPTYLKDPRFYWLAACFAAATLVFSALSSFMIVALGTRGFTVDEAVWIAAMVGPMQVLARVVEWMFAGRVAAIRVGLVACTLSICGMLLINFMPHSMWLGALFAACYGATNGILTIVRGTVPAELFGAQRQGRLLGALARPSFFTRSLTPAAFAAALSAGVPMRVGLWLVAAVSCTSLGCFVLATRQRPAPATSLLRDS